ncbi:polysaccharide lyase family 1 protein [Diplodia corticola]|uniref:pectin lyase n=1 Tax=Diplodia corticola TaxID=236234 RepID=A0A1J9RJE8_9PEZI|nr:polysaccharide lyase family 1 protein [Diplodia corticola]OJD40784.1 polysaccharide lyase family 1 protein [Diplodia corticola]
MLRSLITTACLAALATAQSNVVGSAVGFAAGVTGGGDATPAVPADIDELTSWLTDDEPRVILLDKEYDFTGSEGTKTEDGCRPDSNTCGSSGQDALNGPDWCSDSYPTVSVTYDVAATNPIDVKSNKSIVGVGEAGVIRGKGFRFVSGAQNIIFQNVHVTELNPQYIWGGDAFQMAGSDLIWLDHVKISLVGRQMLVTGYETAGRVTISNSELDGQTSWSASCNGEHYWTMLLLGDGDQITFANNYVHDTSGRSPKVGDKVTLHAVNNYFQTNQGHNFDVSDGAQMLVEGNVFEDCKAPMNIAVTGGVFSVPDSSAAAQCSSALGRDCQLNQLTDSGDFGSFTDTTVVDSIGAADSVWEAIAASEVASTVVAGAGIGKISS